MRRLEAGTAWLFLKREYLTRVRTRSFFISTLLVPLLLGGMIALPTLMAGGAVRRVNAMLHRHESLVIACADIALASGVRARLTATTKGEFAVKLTPDLSAAEHARLARAVVTRKIDGYLWLDPGAISSRHVELVTSDPEDYRLRKLATSALWWTITERELGARGMTAPEAATMLARVRVKVQAVHARHPVTNTLRAIAVITVLTTVMIVTLLSYGVMVMRSVMEEKNSRITEILLCYASAEEMMAGKIAGVGAVGLTQIAIWAAIAAAVAASNVLVQRALADAGISAAVVAGFAVFYALGFALYSCLFAAVGAAFNSQDEAQQWNFILVLPLLAGSLLVTPVVSAPSAFGSVVMSMLPMWSPLLMYARMIVHPPPLWQVALSMALLVATLAIAIEICARIYRVGLLMYGKRPTAAEILRWLRYA